MSDLEDTQEPVKKVDTKQAAVSKKVVKKKKRETSFTTSDVEEEESDFDDDQPVSIIPLVQSVNPVIVQTSSSHPSTSNSVKFAQVPRGEVKGAAAARQIAQAQADL